jgi:Phage integrase, N-terminal SAM-like domain
MIDDMPTRNMSVNTQNAYIRAVKKFSLRFGKSPRKLSFEDVRKYQLHLLRCGHCGRKLHVHYSGKLGRYSC